jgi:hypothetical protein
VKVGHRPTRWESTLLARAMVARGASQKRRRSATPAKGWIIMATLTAGSEANPRARRREQRGWVFYEISERGTSWLGAVTFATVNQLTGSYPFARRLLRRGFRPAGRSQRTACHRRGGQPATRAGVRRRRDTS